MVNFDLAIQHFKKVDLLLADITTKMLKNNNLPSTTSKTEPTAYVFHLYSSIISQQISTKAADKILDPACGSGSFLRAAIHRIKQLNPKVTVEELSNNIYGIDIHPLSVQIAKTTMLLALGKEIIKAKKRSEERRVGKEC